MASVQGSSRLPALLLLPALLGLLCCLPPLLASPTEGGLSGLMSSLSSTLHSLTSAATSAPVHRRQLWDQQLCEMGSDWWNQGTWKDNQCYCDYCPKCSEPISKYPCPNSASSSAASAAVSAAQRQAVQSSDAAAEKSGAGSKVEGRENLDWEEQDGPEGVGERGGAKVGGKSSRPEGRRLTEVNPNCDNSQATCPQNSQDYLAQQVYWALSHAGYTLTAKYLELSGALLKLEKPGTFLAPANSAYSIGSLPLSVYKQLYSTDSSTKEKTIKALMEYQLLTKFRTYGALIKGGGEFYTTYYKEYVVEKSVYCLEGNQRVGFYRVPRRDTSVARIWYPNLYCNSLVIVQGTNSLLIPPGFYGKPPPPPPPKSKEQLAKDAIYFLEESGYTATATLLKTSGALLQLDKQGSFLAPYNKAYEKQNLPESAYQYLQDNPNGGEETNKWMELMTLREARTYTQFYEEVVTDYTPVLVGFLVESKYVKLPKSPAASNGRVAFNVVPAGPVEDALVVSKNIFINSLVIIQLVNRVLIPPEVAPAPIAPVESPHMAPGPIESPPPPQFVPGPVAQAPIGPFPPTTFAEIEMN